MKKIFLLISYIIFFSTTKSQINKYGIPFITNYSSAIYSAEAQNWGITSDKRGIMYFANNNCVLEYDGNKWTQIFLPDNITVRSLACDNNGIVYVGAANNFGCLLPDSTGLLKYHSLKNKLDTAFHNFEEIWKIYIIDSNIYFSGKHFLLKYDYDTVIPTYTYQEQGNLFYFINQKNIFLSNYLNGLIYFDYESERIKQNYSIFKNKYITGIIKTSPNTFLIITYLNGIFELNITTGEVSVKNIPPETQEVLKQALILQATKLKNEDIVFSTNQSGIIITDKKYNIKNIISDKEQLQDATCYFSYEPGKETPLWTALNSGISKIEISSPYRFLDKSFGFEGSIWAINQKDSILYIGTNLGLFYLDYQDNEPVLKKIKFSNFSTIEVWTLLNFRGRMLIGTNFGLFEVIDNKAELVTITNQSNNFSIKTLFADPEDSSKLIIGRENGINILKIKNNFFVLDTLINLPQKEIRSISKDNNGNIWLGTHFNGLIKIDKNYNIKFYDKSKGLPTLKEPMVNTFRGKLFFATPMGLYTYDKSTDSIIPFTDFGVEFSNTHTYKTFVKGNSIWLNTARNNTEFIKQINFFNDSLQIDSSKFKRVKFKNIQSIFVDKNNILWIGTDKILYSFDLNKNFNNSQPFTTLIREVLLNKDSTLFNGTFFRKKGNKIIISTHQTPQFVKEIKYKYNTITFVWSSTFYENENATEYSFKLENFDTNWSHWSKENKFVYTNLPEGNYTFKVKARNTYGSISPSAEFSFIILPPWYRTIWAYIGYFILLASLIFIIVKLYTRKLKMENIKLEKIVSERTKEIRMKNAALEQQKEEIAAQRDEIEEQHKVLMQKNQMIELQNKNIKSSITYASRIQEAILPNSEILKQNTKEAFILYKPRDIVSGDFYWFKKINTKIYIVASDCTGHGVPGAFMSMLGISLLNEITDKNPNLEVNEILNILRERIILSLHQRDERSDSKDGMDIAIVIYDEKNNILSFSGANNPLIIIRKKSIPYDDIIEKNGKKNVRITDILPNVNIIEIKPNRMPVGIYYIEKDFTASYITPRQGDIYYIFSDGFQDQFGGEKGQKFMIKNLKLLLGEMYEMPLKKQKEKINQIFEKWISYPKNENETFSQMDDILIIGFRLF